MLIDRRHSVAGRQRNDRFTICRIEGIRHRDEAATRIARLCGNNSFDLILRVNRGVTYLNGKRRCGGLNGRHEELERHGCCRVEQQRGVPTIYYNRFFTESGGLITYGADYVEQFRQVPEYIDRILRGEKPADLPIQAPTKFELVINLKTAKTMDLDVPPLLLGRADEVIE